MLYDGRPELPLPPAPDTPLLSKSLACLSFSGSLAGTHMLLTVGFGFTIAPTALTYLPVSMICLYIWAFAFALWLSLRRDHEHRYWTPARVKQACPDIWLLYCAGNGQLSQYQRSRRGLAS